MSMKVYPDNNILVYLESGKYQMNQFLSVQDAQYYFSEIHMDELMNGLDNNPELKDVRLNTILALCGSNYITPDLGPYIKGGHEEKSPQEIFSLSMRLKFIHDQLYKMSNAMRINREGFLNELKLERIEIGNYKPSEILNVLDARLKQYWGYGLDVYLEKSEAITGRTVFATLFNLLDFVCYWRDKNNAARLYDSSHAYFARYCDALVSNDKRMRIKAEAVYSYLGVSTKVLTADEFLS